MDVSLWTIEDNVCQRKQWTLVIWCGGRGGARWFGHTGCHGGEVQGAVIITEAGCANFGGFSLNVGVMC